MKKYKNYKATGEDYKGLHRIKEEDYKGFKGVERRTGGLHGEV